MRARFTELALALTLVLSGCVSEHRPRAETARPAVDVADFTFAEALAHYSQALIDEASPGGWDRSLEHWRAAAEADPGNTALRLKLGGALLGRKDVEGAIRTLEVARRNSPATVDVRLMLGMAYQIARNQRGAEAEYREVIRLASDHSEGYVRLAALYLAQGRQRKALAVLDEGARHPGAARAVLQFLENMGRLYVVNGQVRDAIACFERLQARLPDSTPLREVLARCYAIAGDRAKAIAGLEEVVRRDPENGQAALFLGELYEEQEDYARAAERFDYATRHSPQDSTAFLRLAFLQLQVDRKAAMETLRRAEEKFPEDPAVAAYLGLAHTRDGRYNDAVEAFARAESLTAKAATRKQVQPQFYFWYGSACEKAGRFEQAETLLETCIAADPEADEALNYLAYMWAERGIKLDKALEYVTRALAIAPDDGAYIDTLGWIHYKRGDYELALKTLRRAADILPDDPTIREHVGDALQALGQTREALRHWVKSLQGDPRNAGLREKLRAHGVDPDSLLRKDP